MGKNKASTQSAALRNFKYSETEVEAAVRILSGFNLDDFETITIMNNQVVMVIYTETEKTKGGIIKPESRLKEAEYQGKVGLIIAMGATACRDEGGQWFQGKKPIIGDWIVIRASDGFRIDYYGIQCRQFDDTLIKTILPHPEAVW